MNQKLWEGITASIALCRKGQKQYGEFAVGAVDAVALELAQDFEDEFEEPRFNRKQFLKDCGLPTSKTKCPDCRLEECKGQETNCPCFCHKGEAD